MVGKIYAEILVDTVQRVTGGFIEDEQAGFRAGSGCVRKHKRKNVSFIDWEKAYDRVNKEALWQMLRRYYAGDKLLSGIKSMLIV